MTPQLQQAIRLLQLPTIELQAHIRAALEANVMLELDEDSDTATFQPLATTEMGADSALPADAGDTDEAEDGWSEAGAEPADNPWHSGDDTRVREIADDSGQTLRDHLLWQLGLQQLDARALAIGRALIDAINDDGYLGESLAEISAALRPEITAGDAEVAAVLAAHPGPGSGRRRRTQRE